MRILAVTLAFAQVHLNKAFDDERVKHHYLDPLARAGSKPRPGCRCLWLPSQTGTLCRRRKYISPFPLALLVGIGFDAVQLMEHELANTDTFSPSLIKPTPRSGTMDADKSMNDLTTCEVSREKGRIASSANMHKLFHARVQVVLDNL